MRAEKAREYGARRVETWSDDVTHIIADKGLKVQDVLKHLKVEVIPVRLKFFTFFPMKAHRVSRSE